MSEKDIERNEKVTTRSKIRHKTQPMRYRYEDKKETHTKNEPKTGPSGDSGKKHRQQRER